MYCPKQICLPCIVTVQTEVPAGCPRNHTESLKQGQWLKHTFIALWHLCWHGSRKRKITSAIDNCSQVQSLQQQLQEMKATYLLNTQKLQCVRFHTVSLPYLPYARGVTLTPVDAGTTFAC